MHVAIAGNIGSGKTTLAKMLSKHYGWELQLEDMDENPYISDFYDDMQRWSFNLQVYFLHNRFAKIKKLRDEERTVVQDRSIYEDAQIFAPNLHAMGLMSTRDFDNYMDLFKNLNTFITPPDVMIYLRASIPKLVEQIQKRGRDYEQNIEASYLQKIHDGYSGFIKTEQHLNTLIIDVSELDFVNNYKDYKQILSIINLHDSTIST